MGKFQQILDKYYMLLEKKRKIKTTTGKKVKEKSLSNRKQRAENVEITDHETSDPRTGGRYKIHTCKASSAEKSESEKHKCRVKVVKQSGKIDSANCTCSDFQSRYQYYRNKEGVSEYDELKPIKAIFNPHTREKPDIMNPNEEGYMCKHLIAFINKITKNEKS